jgi:hypothetical protein
MLLICFFPHEPSKPSHPFIRLKKQTASSELAATLEVKE